MDNIYKQIFFKISKNKYDFITSLILKKDFVYQK